MTSDPYVVAFTDWLACAVGGAGENAAIAARLVGGGGVLDRVVALAAAGHVLDFDDTYQPGLSHLSAATAPAALALGVELGASIGAVLDAYAAGFEAMGTLARICHPALYDGGWHPTAVCGSAGAAVVAARLLGLQAERARTAIALALLRAGGLRAAFGSDGKALQVAIAAADGVQAARLAASGAMVDAPAVAGGVAGFAEAFGVTTSGATLGAMLDAADGDDAVAQNWIKAYPCCLQTHAVIDAALAAGAAPGPAAQIAVRVHPLSRQAAARNEVGDGLQAKFSIPYLAAYALLHGAPDLDSFAAVDPDAARLARRIAIHTDPRLGVTEAILEVDALPVAHVMAPAGSPGNPLDERALARKVHALAGDALAGLLVDRDRPASVLTAAWSSAVDAGTPINEAAPR
ncbi:MAG TPA: MmgE/PrpD family protein [Solirubrobacteraceae bacterium]